MSYSVLEANKKILREKKNKKKKHECIVGQTFSFLLSDVFVK